MPNAHAARREPGVNEITRTTFKQTTCLVTQKKRAAAQAKEAQRVRDEAFKREYQRAKSTPVGGDYTLFC